MLMVTTTVGMLDGVHGHTTDLGPAVPLGLELVVGATGLQHGLVDTAAAGDDADHGAVGGGDDLEDEIDWVKDNASKEVTLATRNGKTLSGSVVHVMLLGTT